MTNARILVVEDEADLRDVITYNLRREGYQVVSAANGRDGERLAREKKPDLILLDLMLPDLGGLEVCRRVRQEPALAATRIIIVTAKDEESDVVLGLGLGADDYVAKPFSVKELMARIQAVLRRGAPPDEDEAVLPAIRRGPLQIEPARHEVLVDGRSETLTATEFRLLHFLAQRPGRVYERDQLLRRVLGDDSVRLDRTIDAHIRSIRKKLGEHRDLVETVRGVGYRFRADA